MHLKPSPEQTAQKILNEKFPDCRAMFLAGSVIRGEATEFSDLDIVVVYDRLDTAWRDAFYFDTWPVEVFVHDPETLNYFYENFDISAGIPSLSNMVVEGKEIPGRSEFSQSLKQVALKVIDRGPVPWTKNEIDRGRYFITDICDDLRQPRNEQEMMASAFQLYDVLTNFYFRSKNQWSAKGKSIPKKWLKEAPELGKEFTDAFDDALIAKEASTLITFSEKILSPYGGWLFVNSKTLAPKEWRIAAQNSPE